MPAISQHSGAGGRKIKSSKSYLLSYIVNLRLVWATCNSVSKKRNIDMNNIM